MPVCRLLYIDADSIRSLSSMFMVDDSADSTRRSLILDSMLHRRMATSDDFLVMVSELVDATTRDPGDGVVDVYESHDVFMMRSDLYNTEWDSADFLYIRNDSDDTYAVMTYDGASDRILPHTVTVWNHGTLEECLPVRNEHQSSPEMLSIITKYANTDEDVSVKVLKAYQGGRRDAIVSTEVARFERLAPTPANGPFASILSLFLTTVDEEHRTMVHEAILDKYR